MRKAPRPLRLDLVAPVRRARLGGAILCAAGLGAAVAVGLAFQRTLAERSRLEAALGATPQPRLRAAAPVSQESAEDAAAVARELAVPWTRLLAELEAASHDSAATVSLLRVEPDAAKHVVRITAEVRALGDALAYVRRLQRSPVLRHPMLESHERRRDDPEHPLRVTFTAEWLT